MRRLIATVVVAQLTGCVSYRASQVVAVTGGVALLGGIVGAAVTKKEPRQSEHDLQLGDDHQIATGFIFLGLVLGISGLIGLVVNAPPAKTP